jgi:murein DD-endopeptidase MepM/ murein hydrolase activator NlpD
VSTRKPLPVQLTSPVLELTSVGAGHPTAGLPGYPAHDWYAPAGSPVLSPADGLVVKLSGHDPANGPESAHGAFGWSVYVRTSAGIEYYLTHLATRAVVLHSRVVRGTRLGTVAPWHLHGLPDHVHMGVAS